MTATTGWWRGALRASASSPFLRRFSPGLPHYLFLIVFLVRLVDLGRFSASALLVPARGDMHFYNEWALRILHAGPGAPGAFYGLPLYPYFLAAIYRIFGYTPFVPAFLQVLLDAGTAVLIYQLASHFLSNAKHRTPAQPAPPQVLNLPGDPKLFGALAALAWAFYVPAQAYSIVLMPTSYAVFAFWLVVWWIVRRQALSWKECLGLGLLIGVSAMAVATIVFLVPLVLGALLLKGKIGSSARFSRRPRLV